MLLGSLANVWLVSALHLFSESSERRPMQTLEVLVQGCRGGTHTSIAKENQTMLRPRDRAKQPAVLLLALRAHTAPKHVSPVSHPQLVCDRAYVRPQHQWTTGNGARFDRGQIARECREVVDRLRAQTQRYSGLSTPDWRAVTSRAMVSSCRCPHLWS